MILTFLYRFQAEFIECRGGETSPQKAWTHPFHLLN